VDSLNQQAAQANFDWMLNCRAGDSLLKDRDDFYSANPTPEQAKEWTAR